MVNTMATETGAELLGQGWRALSRTEWETARSCFARARELEESPEALDGLGRALHFQSAYEEAIELTERAFAGYREAGEPVKAADRARWLAFLHACVNGNMAAAGGWMARAEELLDGAEECPTHGWMALDNAPFTRDPQERERLAAAALAIARRFGDTDLEYTALALRGESFVSEGRVTEGMRCVDAAMTAVSSGEVESIVAVSDICCRLLGACEISLDLGRAEQWMPVIERLAWQDFVPPVCRTHYGGILIEVGRWDEAERQLVAAIETLERSYRLMREGPLLRLADLRLRQGRLGEARRLLEGSDSHPLARRTLAAIALAEGEPQLADEWAELCLEGHETDDPRCAPALGLLVAARLAREDTTGALEALERLRALAAAGDGRARALASLARGRVSVAAGEEDAISHLQAAHRALQELDLPFEAAQAQLELGRALAPGKAAAATKELEAALRQFEALGATASADATASVLRGLGGSGRAWPKGSRELTKRETEVLALLGEGCSNATIAERLFISRRTAEHHVSHVLSKLGVRNRAEAAAHAVREQGPNG